jgi:hypothetical protein
VTSPKPTDSTKMLAVKTLTRVYSET